MKTPSVTFTRVRRPAVAGTFYPADPESLRACVNDYLKEAAPGPSRPPKAVIAPHAGYIYSGPIAGSAFAPWRRDQDRIRRVLLLGPSHRVPLVGLAASSADAFATPLGEVATETAAIAVLGSLPQVEICDEAHAREHSLEVQLPFLQMLLPAARIVPLVVGEAQPEEVAACLDCLWGNEETRIVVSSDLSHYLDYTSAQRVDRATADKIEQLDYEDLEVDAACGCAPVRGLLLAARRHRLKAWTVDLRNSGDTAGSRDRVVGYGAFAFMAEDSN